MTIKMINEGYKKEPENATKKSKRKVGNYKKWQK